MVWTSDSWHLGQCLPASHSPCQSSLWEINQGLASSLEGNLWGMKHFAISADCKEFDLKTRERINFTVRPISQLKHHGQSVGAGASSSRLKCYRWQKTLLNFFPRTTTAQLATVSPKKAILFWKSLKSKLYLILLCHLFSITSNLSFIRALKEFPPLLCFSLDFHSCQDDD